MSLKYLMNEWITIIINNPQIVPNMYEFLSSAEHRFAMGIRHLVQVLLERPEFCWYRQPTPIFLTTTKLAPVHP